MNEEIQYIDKKLYKELITIQKTLNNFGLYPTKTFIQRLDGTLFNLCDLTLKLKVQWI